MEGLTFVITGVLESLEREEAKSLVERYGGKVTGSVSKRTRYIVVGRDPGAAKVAKVTSIVPVVLCVVCFHFRCVCFSDFFVDLGLSLIHI